MGHFSVLVRKACVEEEPKISGPWLTFPVIFNRLLPEGVIVCKYLA